MKKLKISIIIFLLLVVIEVSLRLISGMCDALLYQENNAYEYIAQPNQNRFRFLSHIQYNSYSQRNSEEPDSTKVKVLGLGDSVIFGGTMLDQDSIATTLFSQKTGMQMLNIAAGSWGPDNCAAYLREKGIFEASAMVLVCSSHDAYDTMTHIPVVGIYPNYPNKQYKLAIWELINRYLTPKILGVFKHKRLIDPDAMVVNHKINKSVAKKSTTFNPGFDELKTIADSAHIPFMIYLHAELNEVMSKQYNTMGQEIIMWANNNHVKMMQGLHHGENMRMYRDEIHFNEQGQKHLAKCLEKMIIYHNFANTPE